MQAGSPFLIAFVHLDAVDENLLRAGGQAEKEERGKEQDEETGKGKEREKEKEEGRGEKDAAKNDEKPVTAPRSIVGLVKGESSPEISNLRKFVAVTKQQLQESGAGCVVLDEKEVPLAGSRGYQILYTANAPPGNQRMKCLQRLVILGEHNYVLLFQTLEALFDAEFELASPLMDSFQTFT